MLLHILANYNTIFFDKKLPKLRQFLLFSRISESTVYYLMLLNLLIYYYVLKELICQDKYKKIQLKL